MASEEHIELARRREIEKGCDCGCELVTDPERVREACERSGADPHSERVIVFYHPFTCKASRVNWAPYN